MSALDTQRVLPGTRYFNLALCVLSDFIIAGRCQNGLSLRILKTSVICVCNVPVHSNYVNFTLQEYSKS